MKKSILAIIFLSFFFRIHAQSLIQSTGFDGYSGTVITVPAGWVIGWNATNSFYTSAGNFGVASPSYKFGNDSDFVVAPKGIPGIDSASFFVKGNGGPFSMLNELRIFQSPDSVTWTLSASMSNLPTSGTTLSAVLNGDPYVMFVYHKEPGGGNIAFDDVQLFSYTVTGISAPRDNESVRVFPSPSSGIVYVSGNGLTADAKIEVFDMLGNQVRSYGLRFDGRGRWTLNLSGSTRGIYMIRIRSGQKTITRRITITD